MGALLRGITILASLIGIGAFVGGDKTVQIGDTVTEKKEQFPWWVHLLGIGVVVWVGYLIYKQFKKPKSKNGKR